MTNHWIKQYILITFGISLVAIAVEYFFVPNNLAAGGVIGIAIVINSLIPKFAVSTITLVSNLILFVVAFLLIGRKFGGKTLYASVGLSVIMWILEKFFNPFAITQDLIIATIFGTLIAAFGIAIVFNNNSTTGGTDIIAKILNKFFHINMGKALLLVDIIITIAASMVFGLDIGFYAMLSVIILGISIDKFIDGFNTSKEIMIMSPCVEDITKFILNELKRGCTYLKGEGAYSGENIKIIYAVLSRSEFIRLKTYIKGIDERAFISVRESYEVLGEGFMKMD